MRIERVTGPVQFRRARNEPLDKGISQIAMDQQPRTGVANLPGVVENPYDRPINRGVEVSKVGHEDLRAFATGFERYALEVGFAGIDHELLAGGGRSGEADLGNIGVQRQRASGFGAATVDDVEHAGWTAGLEKQLRQPDARQRRLFGGLEHHTIARCQCRRDFPRRHQERIVPC